MGVYATPPCAFIWSGSSNTDGSATVKFDGGGTVKATFISSANLFIVDGYTRAVISSSVAASGGTLYTVGPKISRE